MKQQKGFIQIPLLIAIIVASVSVVSAGTSIILYKQGKLSPLAANISKVFERVEEPVNEDGKIEIEESQTEEGQELEEIGLKAEKDRKTEQIQQPEAEKPNTKTSENVVQPQPSEVDNNNIDNLQKQIDVLLKQIGLLQQSQTQQRNQTNINESSPAPNQITTQEATRSQKEPEYELKILTFTPIYADIDYENPPNKEINYYKVEVQFGDKNNIVDSINGNLKIFLENKYFQGITYTSGVESPSSNVLIFDNFREINTELSNPFVFKYTLTRFPKNQDELSNYFLTATYKDQRYRIPIGNYFNFEHIPECDKIAFDIKEDMDIKRALSSYGNRPTEIMNKYLSSAKTYQCYQSLRYKEMQVCLRNILNYGFNFPSCEILIKNAEL